MGIFDGVLLVSDYDDTLYDRTFSISRENRAAIDRFLAEGGLFSVSTGRSYINFAIQMERERLPISVPVILSNGASIYDFGKGKIFWERNLPPSATEHLVEICERFPEAGFEAYHGDAVYTFRPNTATERHLKRCRLTGMPRPIEDMPTPWLKVILQHEEEGYLEKIRRVILSKWGELYDVTFSNPTLLEMTAKGANKGEAVLRLAEHLNIKREHLYCIGNGMNDIPMLAVSAIPYAPADSYQQVLDWGARILPPCNESCVAKVIEELEVRYKKQTAP